MLHAWLPLWPHLSWRGAANKFCKRCQTKKCILGPSLPYFKLPRQARNRSLCCFVVFFPTKGILTHANHASYVFRVPAPQAMGPLHEPLFWNNFMPSIYYVRPNVSDFELCQRKGSHALDLRALMSSGVCSIGFPARLGHPCSYFKFLDLHRLKLLQKNPSKGFLW